MEPALAVLHAGACENEGCPAWRIAQAETAVRPHAWDAMHPMNAWGVRLKYGGFRGTRRLRQDKSLGNQACSCSGDCTPEVGERM